MATNPYLLVRVWTKARGAVIEFAGVDGLIAVAVPPYPIGQGVAPGCGGLNLVCLPYLSYTAIFAMLNEIMYDIKIFDNLLN